jgi:hypothetical protein
VPSRGMQSSLPATLLSITVIAAFLLGGGGVRMIAVKRDRKKGLLMLIAGLVLLANVLIWTV